MSSAPSGRYQSRFFNFVARRSRQFTDKLDQTIRQMKVATVWGAQILLYPFYALFQTSRLVGRQLQTSVAQNLPRLIGFKQGDVPDEIPKVDRPVQKVLEAIATWELPAITTPLALASAELEGELAIWSAASDLAVSASTPLTVGGTNGAPVATEKPAIAIQGVASLLETRSLVLVTPQNQILNVLTPAQQQQLHHRIVWEVSDYQRSLRLATRRPWRSLLGSQPKSAQILPPVRWLYRLMAWVQTSPVAIAANLFQESTLVVQSRPELPHSNFTDQPQLTSFDFAIRPRRQFAAGIVPLPPISYSTLAPLDRAIAELETHPWLPTLATLPTAIAQRVQGLVQQWQQQLATTDTTDLASGPNSPTQQSLNGIQALIRAAVNYFFFRQPPQTLVGDETELEPESGLPSPSPFYRVGGRSDRQLLGHDSLDPDQWLTFGDLFDNPIVMDQGEDFDGGSVADPDKLALASSTVVMSFSGRASGWLSVFPGGAIATLVGKAQFWARTIVRVGDSAGVAHQPQWGKASTIALRGTLSGTLPATSPDSSLDSATRSANQINTTWIETKATTVGYVKHPLERVLEWLDRAMLWMEEWAVKIGQWLQQLWHR